MKKIRVGLLAVALAAGLSLTATTTAQAGTCGGYCERQPAPYTVVGCYQYAWDYANHYWRWMLICI